MIRFGFLRVCPLATRERDWNRRLAADRGTTTRRPRAGFWPCTAKAACFRACTHGHRKNNSVGERTRRHRHQHGRRPKLVRPVCRPKTPTSPRLWVRPLHASFFVQRARERTLESYEARAINSTFKHTTLAAAPHARANKHTQCTTCFFNEIPVF